MTQSISCTESWKLRPVVSPLHVDTPLHPKLSAALNFLLMSLPHALDQHSVTRTNNFLPRPALSWTRTQSSASSRTHPCRKCGYPQPERVNPPRAGLRCVSFISSCYSAIWEI